MADVMSRQSLMYELQASLHDAANVFTAPNDDDFHRLLDIAALDIGRVSHRTLIGEVTLIADQAYYQAPADMLMFKSPIWGISERRSRNPWEAQWPGRLPSVSVADMAGVRSLVMTPAPTAQQISAMGSTYRFFYFGGHVIGDAGAQTSVPTALRGLLILRAQAEACKEMAMRNMGKPVTLRDGMTQGPRNGTPAALYEQLMAQFERAAA